MGHGFLTEKDVASLMSTAQVLNGPGGLFEVGRNCLQLALSLQTGESKTRSHRDEVQSYFAGPDARRYTALLDRCAHELKDMQRCAWILSVEISRDYQKQAMTCQKEMYDQKQRGQWEALTDWAGGGDDNKRNSVLPETVRLPHLYQFVESAKWDVEAWVRKWYLEDSAVLAIDHRIAEGERTWN